MTAKGVKFAWILVVLVVGTLAGNVRLVAEESPSDAGQMTVASTAEAPRVVRPAPITSAPAASAPAGLAPVPAVSGTDGGEASDPPPDASPFNPEGSGISVAADDGTKPDDCQNVLSGCGDGWCGPAGRFWMRADYLMWWTKGSQLPPLVTTSGTGSDPSGLPPGALGRTDTTVLFGGSQADNHGRSGLDITLGMWLDCCHTWGIEGNYFNLGELNDRYDSGLSNGYPLLARPFFDTDTSGLPGSRYGQNAEAVAFPGKLAGRVTADASDYFESGGAHFRHNLCCWECCDCARTAAMRAARAPVTATAAAERAFRLDVIGGYRYYGLSDNVSVQEQLVTLAPLAGGEQINITDTFRTRNFFNGSELGLIADYYHGRWSLEASAKMSMGWNHEVTFINGATTLILPNGMVEVPPPPPPNGGLLGLYTNNGSYSQEVFMVIPEFGMQIGYQLTARLAPLSATTSSIGPRWRVPPTRSICASTIKIFRVPGWPIP